LLLRALVTSSLVNWSVATSLSAIWATVKPSGMVRGTPVLGPLARISSTVSMLMPVFSL
jgi:hypothetical protein